MKNKHKKTVTIVVFTILLLTHAVLTIQWFPLEVLFSDKPIMTDDYPFFYFQARESAASIGNCRFWQVEPHSEAHVGLIVQTNRLLTLILLLTPKNFELHIFKFVLFLSVLVSPILFYYINKHFASSRLAGILGFLLAVYVINFEYIIRIYNFLGLNMYLLGTIFSLFVCSVIYINRDKITAKKGFLFLLLILVSVQVHVLAFLTYAIILPFLFWDRIKVSHILSTANHVWKNKAMALVHLFLLSLIFLSIFFPAYFLINIPAQTEDATALGLSTFLKDLDQNPVRIGLIVFGFASLILEAYYFRSMLAKRLLIPAFLLFMLGYFGSYLPVVSGTKPHRFIILLVFMLIMPISASLARVNFSKRKYYSAAAVGCSFCLLFIPIAAETKSLYSSRISDEPPERTQKLLSWITGYTELNSTILIEGSPNAPWSRMHLYGGHSALLFHDLTGRNFLANAEYGHYLPLKYWNVHLKNGMLNGQPISKEAAEMLITHSTIDYAVVWNNSTKNVFFGISGWRLAKVIDEFYIFERIT